MEEEESEIENDAPPLDVVEEWSNTATIHGMNHLLNRQHLHPWRRRIWLIIMLGSTGVLIWQITNLIKAYVKFEVNTNIKINAPRSLPFPEVTICNVNNIQASKVEASGIDGNPISDEELISISQPLEEFIVAATYNNRDLNVMEVWKPVITTYGLCFQFYTEDKVLRSGFESGLTVTLYVNSADSYNNSAKFGVGVQVFVGQKGATSVSQVPFELGLPGTMQYLGLSRSIMKREREKPWKRCYGEAPDFTQLKCREQCFQQFVRETCDCREYGDSVDTSLPFCDDYEACYQKIYAEDYEECEELDCSDPPCFEEVYITRSSALQLATSADIPRDVIAETVAVVINYDSIREQQVTEVKAQSFSQLLGNIGGQMGLFLGISVISLIEIFGELLPLRLLPRLWGDRRLHGLGSKGARGDL